MDISQTPQLSDKDFIEYLVFERYDYQHKYDISFIKQCYLRFIQAYQQHPDINNEHVFTLALEELERVLESSNPSLVEQYDVQARLILTNHFDHTLSLNFFQYHKPVLLDIDNWDSIHPHIYTLVTKAGIKLLHLSVMAQTINNSMVPLLSILLKNNVARTATEQGWIIPSFYWTSGCFEDENSFYVHAQQLLSGYLACNTEEDRHILHMAELLGINAIQPFHGDNEKIEEIPLHI